MWAMSSSLGLLSRNLKGIHLFSALPSIHSRQRLLREITVSSLLYTANFQSPSPSNMQPNCIASLAYHSSMDFISSFLLQTDPYMYDIDSLDMIAPYNCNGSTTTTISSMSAGTADNEAKRSNDERKKRRLASNRESAKRARVRKQRRLDELSSQVAELRDTNQRLLVELNHIIAKHTRVVGENAKLREEAADLQRRLDEMEVGEAEAASSTPDMA
ncbi:hypothetical protein ACP4OV_009388 [Aristida adscensionis]